MVNFSLNATQIAHILHSVTKHIPRPDGSMPCEWDELTEQQRESAAQAVKEIYFSPAKSVEELHHLWMRPLVNAGWTKGTYDHDNKTHPCLVPFDELPRTEVAKDLIWKHLTDILMEFYHE